MRPSNRRSRLRRSLLPRSRRRSGWALLAAVVVVAAVLGSMFALDALPPAQVAILDQGVLSLHVPLMTLYTVPVPPNGSVSAGLSLGFASTPTNRASIAMQWALETPAALPVVFVFTPGSPSAGTLAGFSAGPANGFLYLPAGYCGGGCSRTGWTGSQSGAGVSAMWWARWNVNYTVREMSRQDGFSTERYLEVDFAPSEMEEITGSPLPWENVTLPGPADLVRIGPPTTISPHYSWAANASLLAADSQLGSNDFHNNATSANFNAGSFGSIRAVLTSEFSWGPEARYVTSVTAVNATLTVQLYVDLRFGSLLWEYVS